MLSRMGLGGLRDTTLRGVIAVVCVLGIVVGGRGVVVVIVGLLSAVGVVGRLLLHAVLGVVCGGAMIACSPTGAAEGYHARPATAARRDARKEAEEGNGEEDQDSEDDPAAP